MEYLNHAETWARGSTLASMGPSPSFPAVFCEWMPNPRVPNWCPHPCDRRCGSRPTYITKKLGEGKGMVKGERKATSAVSQSFHDTCGTSRDLYVGSNIK